MTKWDYNDQHKTPRVCDVIQHGLTIYPMNCYAYDNDKIKTFKF